MTSARNAGGIDFFTEASSVELVIQRMAGCPDPRLHALMSIVVRHLHAAIKEAKPTADEWCAALAFLRAAGRCDDDRQPALEALSDVLGASTLVDAINHRPRTAQATPSTIAGAFHVAGAPAREHGDQICLSGKGEPMVVHGRVVDARGHAIAGATLDVWQADEAGFYDVQQPDRLPRGNLRGVFQSAENGSFWFRTIRPHGHPIAQKGPIGDLLAALGRQVYRPAHIHFIVSAPGYQPVTTQIVLGDDPDLDSDPVFGVKASLVGRLKREDSPVASALWNMPSPFVALEWVFRLETPDAPGAPRASGARVLNWG